MFADGRQISRAFLLVLCVLAAGCQPSRFLEKRHVTYNFEDEGFLSTHLLQTVGSVSLDETSRGTASARRLCLSRAEHEARRRSLRVILHTFFEIPGTAGGALLTGTNTFDRDYPIAFTERDLIRAELDFRELLNRGFIALQENRKRDACSVVFRIESAADQDLPDEIRSVRLTFEPENQQLWRKQPRARQTREQSGTENPGDFQQGNPTLEPGY